MRSIRRPDAARAAAALALVLCACGGETRTDPDGGPAGMDATTSMPDTGTPDPDGGAPDPDAGTPDAGARRDACVPTFEICGDRMDQNCDGRDTSCGNTDGDGFPACRPGEAPPDCDCDDERRDVFPARGTLPGGVEACDGVDNDCDFAIDEAAECCPACAGMVERADRCTADGRCVCSTSGAGDAPCPAGRTCCAGGCIDTSSDVTNCGACGAACTAQSDRCTGGACACGADPPCDKARACRGGACG